MISSHSAEPGGEWLEAKILRLSSGASTNPKGQLYSFQNVLLQQQSSEANTKDSTTLRLLKRK